MNAECCRIRQNRSLTTMLTWTMQECRLYRGIVGSLQYLSIDRCGVQFETNACAKEMKQPDEASWTRLKRFARYLAGTPDSESCTHETWNRSRPTWRHSCESGRTVIGLEMSRTGKVNRVGNLKSMDARCILHHANRKHARTHVAKLSTMLQHRPPVEQR